MLVKQSWGMKRSGNWNWVWSFLFKVSLAYCFSQVERVVLLLRESVNSAFFWFKRDFHRYNALCVHASMGTVHKIFQAWLYPVWLSSSSSSVPPPKSHWLELTVYSISFSRSPFCSNFLSNGYIHFPKHFFPDLGEGRKGV